MSENNNIVKVLDVNGNELESTIRFGKVRHLLKDKKAKIVNKDPFTIQLLYATENEIVEEDTTNNIPLLDITNNTINLAFSDNVVFSILNSGYIIYNDEDNQNRINVVNNIVNQLTKEDVKFDICSIRKGIDVKQTAQLLDAYYREIMNRFRLLEYFQVNSFYELEGENAKPRIIIIDGIVDYMRSDDYKSLDTIKSTIGSISRLGRSVGIYILLLGPDLSESTIGANMIDFSNIAILGPSNLKKHYSNFQLTQNCSADLSILENQCCMYTIENGKISTTFNIFTL